MNEFSKKLILRKRLLKVFLCHSHVDRDTVRTLYSRLKKYGVDVWLDRENLQPGQDWEREIRKAILRSDVVITCLSRGFNKQEGFRHEELKIALEKAKWLLNEDIFIIPVRLEKCDMPESLCHLHRVDLFEIGGYKKLVRAVESKLNLFD
ncbi:MAG: toll/interleukin-1 receptor domain-containing protein [Anaerolineales bacterium]|nr:toll/interleukin-1 receptor domain-containing protein [Anaerolineales bacterium]